VAFFQEAFGATETYRLKMSNGKIAHCELKLGLLSRQTSV
jgi:uncharacterized glyoxalase superfamily protein PhnB